MPNNVLARGLWLLGLAWGCHHAGSGVGELRAPVPSAPGTVQTKGKVTFRWQSGADASNGTISAVLPDGRQFRGTYVQPRTTEWRDDYLVYYGAWSGRWGAAGPWFAGPRSAFATHYSGKALAHLEAPDGMRMRCEFTLYQPNLGLLKGGQGDCQLATGEDVFDAVLREDD